MWENRLPIKRPNCSKPRKSRLCTMSRVAQVRRKLIRSWRDGSLSFAVHRTPTFVSTYLPRFFNQERESDSARSIGFTEIDYSWSSSARESKDPSESDLSLIQNLSTSTDSRRSDLEHSRASPPSRSRDSAQDPTDPSQSIDYESSSRKRRTASRERRRIRSSKSVTFYCIAC